MDRRITTPEHSQSSPPDPDLTAANLPAPSVQMPKRIRDYEIVRELGHGGMGKVYLVRNVISDRLEAMKVLLPELAQDQELTARFMREIKTLATLEHPNIAQLRTAFSTDDQFMMIMEYVEGDTLGHRLEPGPFSVADALNYIGQVLNALSYAHAKGIIHRDIKPANMMLTTQGVVKLMDFGIARSGSEAVMTVPGTTMGSLDYMSPEQVRGEGVDARSDLYSVGVSLYQMVTRARMFSATSSYAIMEAQVKQMPRPPIELQPSLPKALNDIIMFSVAKDPGQRFQNADAFRNALASVSVAAAAAGGMAAQPSVPFPAAVTLSPVAATPPPAMTPPPPMTPAPSTPVPQPSASVTPLPPQPARSTHHLGWILAAAIVILVAIFGGTQVYRSRSPQATIATAPPSGSGQTAPGTPPQQPPLTASNTAPAPVAATPATSAPAASPAPRPHRTEPPAAAPAPSGPSPEEIAAQKKLLDEMETEDDHLNSRAAAVESSMAALEQQMNQSGLGLRGDMVAARANMRNDLAKANQALQGGDIDRARKYLDLAAREVEKLEAFVGRR